MSITRNLDSTLKDRNIEIYEVDGIRGTLKELSDYYNVDPICVSNLMLEGQSIQDALCLAEPNEGENKNTEDTKEKVKLEYSRNIADKISDVFNDYVNDVTMTHRELFKKYGVSSWAVSVNLRKYAENTNQMDLYYKAVKDHLDYRNKKSAESRITKSKNKSGVSETKNTSVAPNVLMENTSSVENNNEPFGSKSVTTVQEFDTYTVITTVTTIVVRK